MPDRIVRHAGLDRLVHWVIAVCVLVLLATAFLPILGIEFSWVTIHWWTGLVLIAAVIAHVFRSLITKSLGTVWIGLRDLRDALQVARVSLRLTDEVLPKSGKFSFAQKLIHAGFAVVILGACVTGTMMIVKIDTPWWEPNPYWLTDDTWGLVYLVHGVSALLLITMVMTHVYFSLRPEKSMFLRAMLLGWITRSEYERLHDADRWQVNE